MDVGLKYSNSTTYKFYFYFSYHSKCIFFFNFECKTNVNPTDIHKDLVIQEGEIKIILQQVINYNLSGNKVGFYLLNPIGRGYKQILLFSYCYDF